MRSLTTHRAYLTTTLTLSTLVAATPQLTFSLNPQIPPIAYVAEPYDFTFSSDSFTANVSEISYTLGDSVTWLSVDASNIKLSGTPAVKDVRASSFEIVATDTTGCVSTNVTLMVLDKNTIWTTEDLIGTLVGAGHASAPASLLLYPQQNFLVDLSQNIFYATSRDSVYYAFSSGRALLPSWPYSDSKVLQLSGTVLLLTSPDFKTQVYSVSLAASNVIGFLEAMVHFQIVVEITILAFDPPERRIDLSPASHVNVASILSTLTLGWVDVQSKDICQILSGPPSWLVFNDSDGSFIGIAPDGAQGDKFSICVIDNQNRTANMTILLHYTDTQPTLPVVLDSFTAPGDLCFSHIIKLPDELCGKVVATADPSHIPGWAIFDPENFTTTGKAPIVSSVRQYLVTIALKNNTDSLGGIEIVVVPTTNFSPSSRASTYVTSYSSSTASSPSTSTSISQTYTAKKNAKIGVAVVLSVVLLVLVMVCTIFCIRRRRKAGGGDVSTTAKNILYSLGLVPITTVSSNATMLTTADPEGQNSQKCPIVPAPCPLYTPDLTRNSRKQLQSSFTNNQTAILEGGWKDLPQLPRPDLGPDPGFTLPFPLSNVNSLSTENTILTATRPEYDQSPPQCSSDIKPPLMNMLGINVSKPLPGISMKQPNLLHRMSGAGHGASIQQLQHTTKHRSILPTTGYTDSSHRHNIETSNIPAQNAAAHKDSIDFMTGGTEGSERSVYIAGKSLERHFHLANKGQGVSSRCRMLQSRTHSARATENQNTRLYMPELRRHAILPIPRRLSATTEFPLPRNISMSSSRQFDSARSSDTQSDDDQSMCVDLQGHGRSSRISLTPFKGSLTTDSASDILDSGQVVERNDGFYAIEQADRRQQESTGTGFRYRKADKGKDSNLDERIFAESPRTDHGSFRFL